MAIHYLSEPDECGKRLIRCDCGFERLTNYPIERVRHMCPLKGPGYHLKLILKDAGATPDRRCHCMERAQSMDAWGPEGCVQNREVIIKWMKEAAFSRWFAEQARIGWALAKEPWFNSLDPFGSIVDEAIRRAQAQARG